MKHQKTRMAKFTLGAGQAWYASPWCHWDNRGVHNDAERKAHNDRVLFHMAGPCPTIDAAIRALVDDDSQHYDQCFVFKGPSNGDRDRVSKVSFSVEIGEEKA